MSRRHLLPWIIPGILTIGLAAGALAPGESQSPQSLARQRLKLAQEGNDALKALRKANQNASSEQVYRWSRRLMEAEMGMSEKKADQIAAINAYLLKMRELEKLAKGGYRNGVVGYLELLDAKWYVLEAESLLSQAKAGDGTR